MKVLKLHVTDLDSWAWFKKIESMPTNEMIGRLLRTEPPNDKMRMGTAWHSIMENPCVDEIEVVNKDGFRFCIACDTEITLPQIREVRACKTYNIDGVQIKLTGKVDGITGNKITDHKLTFRPNPDTYMGAFQWKAYLDIFNADSFEYIIYAAREKAGIVTIHDISTMSVYKYPGMVEDLRVGMSELLGFIKSHVPEMIK